jgi:hypothetical protein
MQITGRVIGPVRYIGIKQAAQKSCPTWEPLKIEFHMNGADWKGGRERAGRNCLFGKLPLPL